MDRSDSARGLSGAIITETAGTLIEVRGLGKRYGAKAALADVSLDVRAGEVFGLLGPNGSGKSTLIRLLMGFIQPSEGSARIEGFDCWRESLKVHEHVSYLPGDVRLYRWMTGRKIIEFFSRIHPRGNLKRALEIADRLELDLTRRVVFGSTGMRQKMAIASVLAADTPLVVLDEPTANLDPTIRGKLLALIREARSAGRTVIFSSHVLAETEQACDRVAILRGGRLVHQERLDDLLRQHRITGRLTDSRHDLAPGRPSGLEVSTGAHGRLEVLAPGELRPVLGWLATLPVEEIRIEPVRLQAVYDRFHPPEAA